MQKRTTVASIGTRTPAHRIAGRCLEASKDSIRVCRVRKFGEVHIRYRQIILNRLHFPRQTPERFGVVILVKVDHEERVFD